MRKVRVLCVGKNQEPYLKEGLAIYEKKLKRYCKFNLQIIKEANYNSGSKKQWLEEEGEKLLKFISPSTYTIICDEKGKSFTSLEFANEFIKSANRGCSEIDFIVGGAFGLSNQIKEAANLKLSFSSMTMTHQMFRLFLSEQIYRAFTIIKKEKYHHI